LEQQIVKQKAREEQHRKRDEAFEEQYIHDAKMALLFEKKVNEVSIMFLILLLQQIINL
jgi:hypothetical protein